MPEADASESPHQGQRGLRRLWNAFLYSLSGLRLASRHESAFRQEVALAVALIPIAITLPVPGVQRVLLTCSVRLVLVVELLNSMPAQVQMPSAAVTDPREKAIVARAARK